MRHTIDAVFTYCCMHFAPRNRRGIPARSGVIGTAMRPTPKASRPNRSAIIFYRAFAAVKAKPPGDFRF
jgi:hypothetical protein